jgi:hypothetical protein
MADRPDNNPRTSSTTEAELARAQNAARRTDINNVNKSGSGTTAAYVIGAIALLIAAYFLFAYDWNTTTVSPPATIDNSNTTVTPPAPDATAPATPPATPPAAETVTPPADAPAATPPADAPATPPAGTTAPATPPATTTP